LIDWHSVTATRPSGTAKPTSSANISTSTSPNRISPANGGAAVTALGRIAEREQKSFIAARKILQPQIAAAER